MSTSENCCQNFDVSTATACVLCKVPICGNCLDLFEHNTICKGCHVKVLAEVANEKASEKDIPMALLGGLVGSIIGASLWALVALISGYQVGFVAIGVGFFAGHGVAMAVSKRKAFFLQIISAIFATFGILLGMMVTSVCEVVKYYSAKNFNISYFNSDLWLQVLKNLPKDFNFFSCLFIVIALFYSWRISAPVNRS